MEKRLDEFTLEMLPVKYQRYARERGITEVFALSDHFGGQEIYIHKPDALYKECYKRKIIQDYASGNYTQQKLADKYGVSPKTVRKYLRESNTKKPI